MKQCVTTDEAQLADKQHHKPCSDCPWRRGSLNGWLGDTTPEEWLVEARGDGLIECHTLLGAQCAGAAIFRTNICKSPRDRHALRLPADRTNVFATPAEFKTHHESEPKL